MLVYQSSVVSQCSSSCWYYLLTFVSFVSVDFNLYSNIRIFFGGFTEPKIRRRIRLAEFFFSADIPAAAWGSNSYLS